MVFLCDKTVQIKQKRNKFRGRLIFWFLQAEFLWWALGCSLFERVEWRTCIPVWDRYAVTDGLVMKEFLILREEVEALTGEIAWLLLLHEVRTEERMWLLTINSRGIAKKEKNPVVGSCICKLAQCSPIVWMDYWKMLLLLEDPGFLLVLDHSSCGTSMLGTRVEHLQSSWDKFSFSVRRIPNVRAVGIWERLTIFRQGTWNSRKLAFDWYLKDCMMWEHVIAELWWLKILCSPKGTRAEIKRLCNISEVGKNLHEEHQQIY